MKKAVKANNQNVPYDDFYDAYFATRGVESTKDRDGNTTESMVANQRKIVFKLDIPQRSKEILDDILFSDVTVVPKEVDVDYSSKEAFTLTQMSEAAQKNGLKLKDGG